ncbi:flagellar hook-basal body complex protein FliE [Sanguibacter sp. HDW7]|uniref:flagellar hook-basal body complex protein FliE n=1 Tax=Sanguibacter sp. HDW7 TaxID=2714931 RepID=UPI00140C6022|nr:flagellar hook-basal body complex protein FliE [Sanguibacter sp. HDW7]QIK84309.1 flagellar hook-basal body complex protein FliE [Sanguibacter sp. HDW7]
MIDAVSAIGTTPTRYLGDDALAAIGTTVSPARPVAASSGDGGFGGVLVGALDELRATQETSDALAVRSVTGDLQDVHQYTIASSQAALMLELTATVRTKAVDAFNEIMRMQA